MNRLMTQDRVRILTVLSEGMGVNAACRVTGASKNTVLKLLADVGTAGAIYTAIIGAHPSVSIAFLALPLTPTAPTCRGCTAPP